jgi:hypothetical protein
MIVLSLGIEIYGHLHDHIILFEGGFRLAQNQDKVSSWSDMSALGLLLQRASTIKIQLSVFV